ncbi:cytochrome c biogenesis protein CcsA [Kamptonema cortianum]|nr:cytochrome c biogenesis protein CcsA [Geitlerinema splendidum]MDK3157606.1 cytochrome c biogenesis protein CcsA [Kamptonema cortianum]
MSFGRLLIVLFSIGMVAYDFMVPDAALFRDPSQARILFFHVPCAFIASYFMIAAAVAGFKTLKRSSARAAAGLHASVEIGTIYILLTLASGILFSRAQWGDWWHNDPRQVSFLLVCLFYLALLALRTAFKDPIQRDRVTGAYALALMLPSLFLVFVYPRLPHVKQKSFHPSDTIPADQLDTAYKVGLWGTLLALSLVTAVLYQERIKLALLDSERENQDGNNSTHGNDSGGDGDRRPTRVRPLDS